MAARREEIKPSYTLLQRTGAYDFRGLLRPIGPLTPTDQSRLLTDPPPAPVGPLAQYVVGGGNTMLWTTATVLISPTDPFITLSKSSGPRQICLQPTGFRKPLCSVTTLPCCIRAFSCDSERERKYCTAYRFRAF